ncbi:hypothetical protein [Arhodomonas aquaeolei]|uniref:hypothetical protein n=1 Tax=Arhodomonas aquaeolei TaxID=2369 RepID=UPI002167E79F|nr:hypothetical protein [Arhodomonas aquaeolei]
MTEDLFWSTVWRPVSDNEKEFGDAFNELLFSLERYVKENDLSMWKTSRVTGVLENILRHNLPREVAGIWVKRTKNRLLKG